MANGGAAAGSASAHGYSGGLQLFLDVADSQLTEVENAGREHRVGAGGHGRGEVRERARPTTRNEGNGDDRADGCRHLDVVTVLRPVRVHRIEQDLPHATLLALAGPGDGIDAGALSSTVRRHFETGCRAGGAPRI